MEMPLLGHCCSGGSNPINFYGIFDTEFRKDKFFLNCRTSPYSEAQGFHKAHFFPGDPSFFAVLLSSFKDRGLDMQKGIKKGYSTPEWGFSLLITLENSKNVRERGSQN